MVKLKISFPYPFSFSRFSAMKAINFFHLGRYSVPIFYIYIYTSIALILYLPELVYFFLPLALQFLPLFFFPSFFFSKVDRMKFISLVTRMDVLNRWSFNHKLINCGLTRSLGIPALRKASRNLVLGFPVNLQLARRKNREIRRYYRTYS